MDRRRFVLGLAAPLAAPVLLNAQRKSGAGLPITGAGEHSYEVIHDWGKLPARIKYGNTHGVCEDSQGRIYVHHTVHDTSESADSLVVFDDDGKFVKSWGRDFKGGAHGLHIRKEGSEEFLYLCDTRRGLVVKTTLDGEEVFSLGYPEESSSYEPDASGRRPRYSPTNLAIGPNGDIYVGDGYGSSFINQYTKTGKFIRSFGGLGSEAGQLDQPHGICVDQRALEPLLLIADRRNGRLQYFTLDGKHHSFVYGVIYPCHFDIRQDTLLIPELYGRVTLMGSHNRVIAQLGQDVSATWRQVRTQPRETFSSGRFVCPHGACFDHEGNIFVVEWVEVGRVTKLRRLA